MKKSIKNFLTRAGVVLLATLLLVVQVNQANPLAAGFDRGEILTDETFTDVGGQYDVFHLLENVSVFSFGDTSGSHIVGPVLSKGMVSKINLDKKTVVDSIPETDLKQLLSLSTEKITVSDLNKGYPSYLGRISNAVGFEGNMRQFISQPNKIVDKIGNIYLGSEYQDGNIIHIKKTKGNGKDDPYKTEIKTLSGYVAIGGPGFVNPDFIDWETAFNEINAQSIQLLNNAKRVITTNDIVNHDGEMYLYVTPGEEVLVPKEIKFDTLGLVVGQENKEKGVFYNLERTIVSYEDSGRTYVKRVVLASDKNDKGSGFGQHAHQIHVPEHGGQTSHGYKYTPIDAGINLVLNYPYATQLVDINDEDQYGHIVAVNAQFAQFTGNSNGVKIVKDYLSPNTETHYWPYNYMAENADVEKVDIHLSKVWIGKVTNKVEVSLLADGETITTVSFGESDNWKYTFKDLEKFDDNGNEIKYEIQETEIKGYSSDITGNSENGFIITNSELTSITVNKKWVGNPLDSVTVNLLLDGKVIDSIGLSDSNEWHHSFDGLLKYDKEGEVLKYRIEELGYEGYTSEVVGDGNDYTITNTQNDNSKLTTLNVSKVWVGDINYDSVSVDLLANNEVIRTFDLSKQNDWKAEFEDLPLFDKDNNKIQYTFKEEKLVDYDVSYSSNDDGIHVITNTHKLINIEVEKQWEGNALDKINGTLTANGNVLYKFKLSNTNQWNKVFLNLPVFDENHKQIEYEVTEDVYAGYLTDIEKVGNKFTITNTFIEDEDTEIPPTEPVDPEVPVDPEEPVDPEGPTDPEEPTEPGKPIDPEEPTTPEESEKPTPPGIGDANRPDKPVEPVKPVPSEKPDLSKPNYGGTFNKDNMTSKDMLPPTGKTSTITFGSVLMLLGYALLKKEKK